MQQLFIAASGISGALAVAIGAFGAHKLEPLLKANDKLGVYNTAVQYHFYHTLALLLVGLLMYKVEHKFLIYAGWCFMAGIVIFSGSLYTLSISNISKLGIITPFGGLSFITGWVLLFVSTLKST